MTIVEMRVHMDCLGCKNKIEKALKKLDGVDNVDVDMYKQKVTVTGWAEQKKVLKRVRKTGRKAELWPFPYNQEHHDYAQHYYNQYYTNPANYYSTYNYRKHGYNGHDHGYYQQPPSSTIFDEQYSSMFSDDNTTGCSIM
ncbi:Heavy metal transport/detoxification superfamily protein [Abeliophyllum distichum]|uniref:Heavy metal transport/detoxification superfamily protein n=1 Tax=Abeliophyllum distichum TaxID=126358 RepID=A0ABD1UGW3_9LAMI